jgi:hypothetical protein
MSDPQHDRSPRGIEAIIEYLRHMQWPFEPMDEQTIVLTKQTPNGALECLARLEERFFTFHSLYPFLVPEGKRMLLAQFVSLANHRTPIGHLDLDLDGGEIGFHTGIAVARDHLTPALVKAVVEANVVTADRWLAGVASACFTDIGPQAAVEQCVAVLSIAEIVALASELLGSNGD